MTNVLRQKSIECIEWTVRTSRSPFVCDRFWFQGRKCHLELTVGIYLDPDSEKSYGVSELYFNSNKALSFSPVKITVLPPDCLTGKAAKGMPIKSLCQKVILDVDSSKVDKSIQASSYFNKFILLDDLSRDFSKLLDGGVNHDVEIICGDFTIKAHKSVLCCRSDVLAKMLQTDMVEGQTGRLNIVDMDATIFQQFIKCLYTGILPNLTLSNALEFYNAGDKYNVGILKKQCSEFLIENLSSINACDFLIVADRHSDADFKKIIIEYMIEKKIPYMGKKWMDFCKDNCMLANEVLNLFCQHLRPK